MDTCNTCGGQIEFRIIGGNATPIHITGGCRQDSYDTAEWGGFCGLNRSSLKYESYVNPNAHCPVCHERVFFYQSEDGGRVFFDDLGPPWPKHPCTDNSVRYKITMIMTKEAFTNKQYKWQKEGWEPFLCKRVEQNEGGITRIIGELKNPNRDWTLYLLGTYPKLGEYPMLIKAINPDNGKYRIATFKLKKGKGIQEIYLDCTLPQTYWKKEKKQTRH